MTNGVPVETVLIVEDDLKMQEALRDRLREDRYRILVANDADQALAVLRREKSVDLILLDLRLGAKSGLDLMDEMREDPAIGKDIDVVVLTAIADPAMVGEVMGRGPTDYLVKADNSLDDIAAFIRKKFGRD